MFSTEEIARSTGAAWTLFKGDAQGLRRLDLSFDGFWRSFGVIVLLLPAFGIALAAERMMILEVTPVDAEAFPAVRFLIARLVAYALDWVDYALVLAVLARPLGLGRAYVPLIVALNWAHLLAVIPVTIPSLLYILGLIDLQTHDFLALLAIGIVLRYQYVVTRIATGGPAGFVIGLVVLEIVGGFFIRVATAAAFGA